MTRRTEVSQLPDRGALARRAWQRVLALAEAAIAEHGAFRIALSGGSTPRELYQELARFPEAADFARWHVFFGDERCVPPDHRDSNYRMARETWLGDGRVPQGQIHRMRGEIEPSDAAAEYEALLAREFATREVPRFDVVLLGMGEDGHVASLFPFGPELEEARRWVTASRAGGSGSSRITFTLRTIDAGRCVLLLVSGTAKATALRDVLHGTQEPRARPASLVKPWDGELVWLVDREAASQLVEGGR
jgi:6-phosphogluconolactonase